MFFFNRTIRVDEKEVEAFADWFLEQGERIISSVENRTIDRQTMMKVLDEVEYHLALVYRDGYKGQIEFDYGGSANNWELNLYHKNNPFLMKATEMIAATINKRNNPKWRVNTSR